MSPVRRYGWKPDLPDSNRRYVSPPETLLAAPPPKADVLDTLGPVLDQGELGSCHDSLTDVLTLAGWKRFADLTPEDRLASVSPQTSALIFERPSRVIRMHYSGEMHYGSHQSLDFAVTPDHTMLVRKWDESRRRLSDEYSFVAMKDLGWYCGLMNSVEYAGEGDADTYILRGLAGHKYKAQRSDAGVEMGAWLRFLGIYLAEGTMLGRGNPNKIQLAASKEREKAFIRQVLADIGMSATELPDRFTFQNGRLYAALAELGLEGVKAPEKFVPDFVFRLGGAQIRELLLGHFMGDGCEQHGLRSYYTSSRRLAEDIQRLIFLSGGWGTVSEREPRDGRMADGRMVHGVHPQFRASQWSSRGLSIDRNENVETAHYEGEVFCAEMPTHHTLVTRRNGKILIAGNCTAHGLAGCVQHNRNQQKLPAMTPSRLMIYYLERELEGSVDSDSGAAISDGIQVLKRYGYCDESLWPYSVGRFKERPPQAAFDAAAPNAVFDSLSVRQTAQDLKAVIASKEPIVFGFTVFESFESDEVARGGVMPIPKRRERKLGGHCVYLCAYDDDRAAYLCRNSWGKGWGLAGNFWMPYSYAHSGYCSDFWVIRSVPGGVAPDDDHDGPVPVPTPTPPPAPPTTKKRRVILEVDCGDIKSAEVVFAG